MTRRCAAALILALGLGLVASAVDAQKMWDQAAGVATAAPIAWFSNGNSTYILYGKTASVDNLQVWEAAEAQCASAGGHLMSVANDNDVVIATKLNEYLPSNGGSPFGSTKLCTWVGASFNVMAAAALAHTDGAAVTAVNASLKSNVDASADIYFADGTSCVAVCTGKYYHRDCDYEAHSFICKQTTSANLTASLASAVKLALVVAADTGVISAAPAPAYPPTYPAQSYPGKTVTAPKRTAQNLTAYYNSTFSKCVSREGNHYCVAIATQSSGQPRTWTEAQAFCNNVKNGGLAGPFTVATIGSDAELAYLLASFPVNASVLGFWTAGVKSPYSKPVFILPPPLAGTAANTVNHTAWLSSKAIAGPTLSPSFDTTWSWYNLASSYVGNCVNGTGCGVALTYNASGNGTSGLQLADLGFGMSVLCKAPQMRPIPSNVNISKSPPVTPADMPICTPYYITTLNASVAVSSAACLSAERDSQDAAFLQRMSKAVADAWNARETPTILPGNVRVTAVTSTCYENDRGDSKLTFAAQISLPTTTNTATISRLGNSSADFFAFTDTAFTFVSVSAANTAESSCPESFGARPDVSCPLLPLLTSTRRENCEVYSAQTMAITYTVPFYDCSSFTNPVKLCELKASSLKGIADAWNNKTSNVAKIGSGDIVITGVRLSCQPRSNSSVVVDALVYLPSSVPTADISSASWIVPQAANNGSWTIAAIFSVPLQVTASCINTAAAPAGSAFVSVRMFAALNLTQAGCAMAAKPSPADFSKGFTGLIAAAWNNSAPATPIAVTNVIILGLNASTCTNAIDGAIVVIEFNVNLPTSLSSAAVSAALPAFTKAAEVTFNSSSAATFGIRSATLTSEPPKVQAAPAPAVTARPPGAQYVKVHLFATLQLSLDNCKIANASQAEFGVQFAAATAAGWNNVSSSKIANGDVVVLLVKPDCGTGLYASTVTLNFDLNLPSGGTAADASKDTLIFQSAASSVYLTSSFGLSFQLSVANITFTEPKLVKQPFAPVSPKAPGAAYISANMYAVLNVSTAACTKVNASSGGFSALFGVAAAAGLTANANFTTAVKDGDVNVTTVSTTCSGPGSTWSAIIVSFTVAMPKGATTSQTNAALLSFRAAGLDAFNTGSLVKTFDVTGVSVTFDAPQQVVVQPPPKTPRKEGEEVVSIKLQSSMKLSAKACQEAASDLEAFTFLFQTATAGAWNQQYSNSTNSSKYLIQVGDVLVKRVLANCGTSRRSTLRSLLADGGSSISVESAVLLPPAISMDSLSSGGSSSGAVNVGTFQAFASDALTTGTFASTYAVTDVAATASEAAATLYQENSTSVTLNATQLGFNATAPINITEPLEVTSRSATAPVTAVNVTVKMILPVANCQSLKGSETRKAEFVYQFKRATAAAWNSVPANSALPMKAGDVTASIASDADISCGTYRLQRSLLAASTVTVTGSMAVGGTADQATAGAAAYKAVASAAYAVGMASFGVTGALTTVTNPGTGTINSGTTTDPGTTTNTNTTGTTTNTNTTGNTTNTNTTSNSTTPTPTPKFNSSALPFNPTEYINTTVPLDSTTRTAGALVTSVVVAVTMNLPLASCSLLLGSTAVVIAKRDQFAYQFKRTTAAAWNQANPSLLIKAGDVTASAPSDADISCTTRRLGRSLLAGSTVTSTGSLAVGGTADQASAGMAGYRAMAYDAYAAGMTTFGVTGASASTYVYVNPETSSKVGLAVGLGVGLGLAVIALVVAAVFIMKRRKAQAVAPLGGGEAPAAQASWPRVEAPVEPAAA